MMNKLTALYRLPFLIICSVFLCACGSMNKVSKFSSSAIQVGISKEAIVTEFGVPSKSEFWTNDTTGLFEERLYYKEIFMGKAFEDPYSITNILFFVDGKLKSLTQGPERRLYDRRERSNSKK